LISGVKTISVRENLEEQARMDKSISESSLIYEERT
jgi:hypothetical protein